VSPSAGLLEKVKQTFQQDPAERTRKEYASTLASVNAYAADFASLSDEQLRAETNELRDRASNGASLSSLLPRAFALVREASDRVLGLRPFDVQIVGGMVLNDGNIAEMRTGEGKTLVAVLPTFLNALAGKGAFIVTVNDYLARRDCEWVGQIHRFLGLDVGLVQGDMDQDERRRAYASDITYVTNSELGFDYLRDNLAKSADELVLRDFNFCIVDEVDSILVDEARTPLIISGPSDAPSDKYTKATKIAEAFERNRHYTVDEKQKSVLLTEEGYEAAEEVLQVSDLYDPREQWALYINNALKAKELQKRDVNYIVREGEVVIVDDFTGRTMPGRRWSDGLHQAVEAKEGLDIQQESVTIASVTYQSLFRSFPTLSGMTGTAATESQEFSTIFNLGVKVVPTNKPVNRTDNPDVVFRNFNGKWKAASKEIKRMHNKGRPVLVGTTSVENSELLAELLDEQEVPYELLNAKPENVQREAEIIAQSGREGAVTISTNMAGRGTDIVLGGNPEAMARLKLREMLMPRITEPPERSGDLAMEKLSRKAGKKNKKQPSKGNGTTASNGWAADPNLFPIELSEETQQKIESAVQAAEREWGKQALSELDAENRLSLACERKSSADDDAMVSLRSAFNDALKEFKRETDAEKDEVRELGGLHVVGTERHESRRIDNQLRGRAARQGDPGSTRFFLSLEDNIFRVFGGQRIQKMMDAFRVEDLPIESGMLTNSLDEAQKKVETYFYDMRKQLFDYDQVLNQQRERIYSERKKALLADREELSKMMEQYARDTSDDIVNANLSSSESPQQWELESLVSKMVQYCHLLEGQLDANGLRTKAAKASGAGEEAAAGEAGLQAVRDELQEHCVSAYRHKNNMVEEIEPGLMPEAERFFVLTHVDNLWKEHLQAMRFIQQAVGLRGFAQKDPLTEYRLEGYNLFLQMLAQIRRNTIYNVYAMRHFCGMKCVSQFKVFQSNSQGPLFWCRVQEQVCISAAEGRHELKRGERVERRSGKQ
jgi:preprotein translocase subunit SecA